MTSGSRTAISLGIKKSEQVPVGIGTGPSIGAGLESLSTIQYPHSRLRQCSVNF
jgi:hypothetical protein